jgi:hypothetical protein
VATAKVPELLKRRPRKPLSADQWHAAMLDVARLYGLEATLREIAEIPPGASQRRLAVWEFKEALLSKLLADKFPIFQAPRPKPQAGPGSLQHDQREFSERAFSIAQHHGKGPMWALKWICNEIEDHRAGQAEAAKRLSMLPARYRPRPRTTFTSLKQAWKALPEELRIEPISYLGSAAVPVKLKKGTPTFMQKYGGKLPTK